MNETEFFLLLCTYEHWKILTIGNDAGWMLLYEEMTGDETIGLETMWLAAGTLLYAITWGTTLAWTAWTVEAGDWPSTLAKRGAETTGEWITAAGAIKCPGAAEERTNNAQNINNDFIF